MLVRVADSPSPCAHCSCRTLCAVLLLRPSAAQLHCLPVLVPVGSPIVAGRQDAVALGCIDLLVLELVEHIGCSEGLGSFWEWADQTDSRTCRRARSPAERNLAG